MKLLKKIYSGLLLICLCTSLMVQAMSIDHPEHPFSFPNLLLDEAIKENNQADVSEAFKKGASPVFASIWHLTTLLENNLLDEDTQKLFLEGLRESWINSYDVKGNSFLVLAVKSRNIVLVKALLDRGAQPDMADGNGQTALSVAKELGAQDIEALLLDKVPVRYLDTDSGDDGFDHADVSRISDNFGHTDLTENWFSRYKKILVCAATASTLAALLVAGYTKYKQSTNAFGTKESDGL